MTPNAVTVCGAGHVSLLKPVNWQNESEWFFLDRPFRSSRPVAERVQCSDFVLLDIKHPV